MLTDRRWLHGFCSVMVRRPAIALAFVWLNVSGCAAPGTVADNPAAANPADSEPAGPLSTGSAEARDKLLTVTASSNADAYAYAYASFRAYGRREARVLWNRARGESPGPPSRAPGFERYHQFRALARTQARQAQETFFKGRYNRSRARTPENIEQWRSQPDIANPGPDLANYPNSPFTLPRGRAYVELSPFTYYGSAAGTPPQYNAEFLLRYGLTDDIELRLFGNGPSWVGGAHSTWGFSPIAFDTKVQLWLEKPEYFLPAGGFEAYLQTQWLGSAPFNGGTQPSFTLLFDQSLPFEIDLSYAVGTTRLQDPAGQNVWELGFQWALQRDFFSQDFALFIHGFYNAATLPRVPQPTQPAIDGADLRQNAVGAGFIWTVNPRLAVYGQVSGGTTRSTPQPISMLGLAVSF